ncbi:MAG: hypothetical protein OEW17_01880 [Gemmatimonadota bacterium]|nr:hypothetical protein [Gemmatimonadota bacterium]MDH4347530.1 hypothetical protein [Gemmatimonadota bacterium]MDH5282968.1 hypothetical protein [Gemmatimonadota bacterium]
MKKFAAAVVLLAIAGCAQKEEAAPAADTTAAAPAPAVDTMAPMATDSVMARDTAAAQ